MSESGGVNEDASFSEGLFLNGHKIKILTNQHAIHVNFENKKMYGFEDKINWTKYAAFPWVNELEYIGQNDPNF